MAISYGPIPGQPLGVRAIIQDLTGGWTTRTAPHLLPDNYLYVANNVVYYQDGIVSKRPGNSFYGTSNTGNGRTGSGEPIQSMFRFYPVGAAPQLLAQSGGNLYKGDDTFGTFTPVVSAGLGSNAANFVPFYDPDAPMGQGAVTFICDGQNVPKVYNGSTYASVNTGTYPASAATSGGFAGNWLPDDPNGNPITPAYCVDWGFHMVYAGQSNDPSALYISDAMRPERFNGFALVDSAGSPYIAYYPGGRDGSMGVITGLAVVGAYLVIFLTAGIVTAINIGSYGSTQFQFYTISKGTGNVAPRSLIPMGGFVGFYGGDAFYATDGNNLWKLPDELPTVYSNTNKSTRPPLIQSPTSVFGVRHNDLLIWSIDTIGTGQNNQCVVFDQSAQGGWSPGSARGTGAWALWPSGMPIGAAVDCRGPGDDFQLYWGSSQDDIVARFDVDLASNAVTGNYADFGMPIQMELSTKALYFQNPAARKQLTGMYVLVLLEALTKSYQLTPMAYIIGDRGQTFAAIPTGALSGLEYQTAQKGIAYGEDLYGTFLYEEGGFQFQQTQKAFFADNSNQGIQPGLIESSVFPFSVMGFILEVIADEPTP